MFPAFWRADRSRRLRSNSFKEWSRRSSDMITVLGGCDRRPQRRDAFEDGQLIAISTLPETELILARRRGLRNFLSGSGILSQLPRPTFFVGFTLLFCFSSPLLNRILIFRQNDPMGLRNRTAGRFESNAVRSPEFDHYSRPTVQDVASLFK